MDKPALREHARRILRGIPAETRAVFSRRICARVESLIRAGSHHAIAAYAALRGEPDLDPLFRDLPCQWALPRMTAAGIELRKIGPLRDLLPGVLGIREPDPDKCEPVSLFENDLILVPGLAFSIAGGGRLGHGKGHYDRFLSGTTETESPPLLCGICFSAQLRDSLPLEEHDIRMDAILTEEGVYFRNDNGHPESKGS